MVVANFILFFVIQLKYIGYFPGSYVYMGIGILHLVFFCLSHASKLVLMKNFILIGLFEALVLGLIIYNIAYILHI